MRLMIKIKPLTRRYTALSISGAVIFANLVTICVLDRNLTGGVYPTDQDSIMIGIAFSVLNSMFILLPALISASLPRNHIFFRIAARSLILVAGLFSAVLSAYWLIPNHYVAGAAFILALALCLWALWMPSSTWGGAI
ncbi:hypothetical protein [Comamonas sp. 4034]|uniref:hypothetical protein n=1 Tax=Comamonas sp. 4034 TaxID=3156455 RepID=UPI003D1B340F